MVILEGLKGKTKTTLDKDFSLTEEKHHKLRTHHPP